MNNSLKKTILNYEILKCELEDTQTLSQEYRDKFYNDAFPGRFDNKLNIDQNSALLNPDTLETPETSDTLRKIYKKLSLKTHPDRNINLPEEDRLENEEIFKEINEYYESRDFCSLLVKAKELRVKIPDLLEEDIKILEVNIKNIQEKLDGIKKEISWQWCTTTCPIQKAKIEAFIKKIIKESISNDYLIEEDIDCAICLDKMERGNIEAKLPCNHIFHKSCILSWFSIKFECPLCRRSFE